MSYCRWSSDDFRCDVYVYAHCDGGYATHVAGRRYPGEVPRTPDLTAANVDEFMAAHKAQHEYLESVSDRMEAIVLPYAGEDFMDGTPGECAARLRELRGLGYRVPDYAIDELDVEERERIKEQERS